MQGVVLAAIACDNKPQTKDPNADVTESITTARCHREVKCDRVGEGKRFRDDLTCHRDLDVRPHMSLGGDKCGGIDTAALAQCLDAIQRAKCDEGDPFEGACGKDALCTRRSSQGTTARLAP